jgi:hypothetical protein
MGRIKIALALLAASGHAALAQREPTGIELLRSKHISADRASSPHIESHIAVDPLDPQHLLATAMVVIDGRVRAYPYASFDGGASWRAGRMIGDSSIVGPRAADPVVYLAPSGTALFSTLAPHKGRDRSLIARSTDGGRTWRTTAVLPNTDRQYLAIDPTRRLFGGRVYFTSTGLYVSRAGARAVAPFLARSDDEGATFPFRTLVGYDRANSDTSVLNAVPLEPLITSGGLLLLTLQGAPDSLTVERARRDSLNAWALGLMISDDGGDSFGPALYAATPRLSITGNARRRIRAHSATGYVRTAVDISSGKYRNRVYFVAADYEPAIDRYVARVWHTSDFGKTWKTAVASDAPAGDIANPAIAINRDGIVAVTWNDRRDDPQRRCWRLYAAISLDGGERFLPAQQLSRAPTCVNAATNWDTYGTALNSDYTGRYLAHFQAEALIPLRFPMGGDTQGLAADSSGTFHAAWINGETGVLQLWYTSFRTSPAVVQRLSSRVAASNPAKSTADPPGMQDVTRNVRFSVVSTDLDFTRRTFAVTLQIENAGSQALRVPLRAIMRHFLDENDAGMGLSDLAAANSDNGEHGVGAAWDFRVPGGTLMPGARSEPRVLLFTFKGGIPDIPLGYLAPGFQVYARPQ